jgi:hypothetical protein
MRTFTILAALVVLPTAAEAQCAHWDMACRHVPNQPSSSGVVVVVPADPKPAPSWLDFLLAPPGQFTLPQSQSAPSPRHADRQLYAACADAKASRSAMPKSFWDLCYQAGLR